MPPRRRGRAPRLSAPAPRDLTAEPARLFFITHPEVVVEPEVPVPDWSLSSQGWLRMRACLKQPWVPGLRSLWCSTERKAKDGAAVLAAQLELEVHERADLGENDRSATGFLPPEEFQQVADQFFTEPEASVRGWERAVDAQARIVEAVGEVDAAAPEGDLAIVAHGGVGALLMAHAMDVAISRRYDQPFGGGGCWFALERGSRRLLGPWARIDDC